MPGGRDACFCTKGQGAILCKTTPRNERGSVSSPQGTPIVQAGRGEAAPAPGVGALSFPDGVFLRNRTLQKGSGETRDGNEQEGRVGASLAGGAMIDRSHRIRDDANPSLFPPSTEEFPSERNRFFDGMLRGAFLVLGGTILVFLAVPVLKMIFSSSPSILWDSLFEKDVAASIALTLYAALIATAIGFVLGVPLAYLLAKTWFPGKRLIEGLVDLPIVIPHSAAGIALLFVFGRNYFAGKTFAFIGIPFLDSLGGIVIAMLFVSVPFLIDSAKEGFQKVDPRLENVARTLGASPWQTFVRISFPLAWRSIMAGNIMMWARGMSEFGAVIIIAYHPMIAPVLVYERFETYGLEYSRPIAVLLILLSMIVFVALRLLLYRGEKS